jgi:ribonuclease R
MNTNKFFEGVIRQENSKTTFCDITELKEPILVDNRFLNRCLTGDRVLIKVKNGKFGFVQKLIERPSIVLTGKIELVNNLAFIRPWTKGFFKDFFVDTKDINSVLDGDVVEFEIKDWRKNHKSPKAKVLRKVYISDEQYMIHRLNLPSKFSDSVIDELKDIEIRANDISNRVDLRSQNIFSIDPSTCTDIDDALSMEKTSFGYRVGIHIADVSHFIKAGSELDKEAYKRSFTYYFPNFNIPMIPQKLSSDLCSLIEGEDRLCVSTIINIDNNLNIIDSNIVRSVINNKKKFSYEEAENHKNDPSSPYFSILNDLFNVGASIRKKWFVDELVLNRPEIMWVVEDNNPIKMKIKNRLSTMDLIQSWMLITNKLVTHKIESLSKNPLWVYRIHNEIEENNLDILKRELNILGKNWDDKISDINNIKYFLNSDISEIFSEILIKKFRPAKYSPNKTGHFSLGVDDYTHFTSPIRRYSDIIVHRILLNSIIGKDVYSANLWKDCEWISEQEKKSQKVENYYNSLMGIKFTKDIKYAINGIVTRVGDYNITIKSEFLIDMYIRYDENVIQNDDLTFSYKNNIYKIGDMINIKIEKIDNEKNQIYVKINY